MAKFTLTVEGNIEELTPIIQKLSQVELPSVVGVTTQVVAPPSQPEPRVWTENEMSAVWRGLTFECEKVLKEIAKEPEGKSLEQLKDAFGWQGSSGGNRIGGRLSSLGHNLRIQGLGSALPYPIEYRPFNGNFWYKLLPAWREFIIQRYDEERG